MCYVQTPGRWSWEMLQTLLSTQEQAPAMHLNRDPKLFCSHVNHKYLMVICACCVRAGSTGRQKYHIQKMRNFM